MLTSETTEVPSVRSALDESIDRLVNRTPEQKQADRAEAMKTVRKGRPLPEGKTLSDVVVGSWPGDETDEQILEALERLS
jgi:hypothetical protein